MSHFVQPYYSLNQYLRDTYGEKVYRLSLDAGMTCPNRDGKLSHGGCSFCSAGGSGDFAAKYVQDIQLQFNEAKARIQQKTNCKSFIAYFQSFTNTYAPVPQLRQLFSTALEQPEVVALAIATRSDCLDDAVINLLKELAQIKPIWIELGYQTMHNETLMRCNTHTSVQQFDAAVFRLHEARIPVVAHMILGLPNENKDMMLQSAEHLAKLPVWGVKIQLLHILKGTALGQAWEANPFPLLELEEYCDLVIDCLELLRPDQVIHRLTGDGPRQLLLAPLWSTDKKRVLNTLQKRLRERDTFQGRLYLE